MKIILQNNIIDLSLVYKISKVNINDSSFRYNSDSVVNCSITLYFLNSNKKTFFWSSHCKNELELKALTDYVKSEYSRLVNLWCNRKLLDLPSIGSRFIDED